MRTSPPAVPTTQGISARNWATLGVLAIVMFLSGTDMTKVAVALPAVASDIGLGSIDTLWVADSYALAAPVLALCLMLARVILDESTNPDAPVLDVPSALLSAAAIGLLIAGLKVLPDQQIPWWTAVAALVAGMAAAAVFVIRQLRMHRPFLDVRLFTRRDFAVAAAVVLMTNGVFTAVIFILTQRFQVVHGMSAVDAGITVMPLAVSSALGGIVGPGLQRRLGQKNTLVCGVALVAVGLLLLAAVEPTTQLITSLFIGGGAGIVMAIGANTIMSAAPQQRTADAGAVQESCFALGAGGGVATLGALSMYLAQTQGDPSVRGIYDSGATAALTVAAIAYICFAVAAALLLLNNRKTAH